MGWFSRIATSWVPASYPQFSPDDARVWTSGSVQMTQSGVYLTEDVALQLSAYWACIRVIAEDVAMLPLIMYRRRDDGGKDRAPYHPLYDVLHDEPNRFQDSFATRFFMTACAASWGNGYARIIPGMRGSVDQLHPIHPSRMTPKYDGRSLSYTLRHDDGTTETLLADEVFHLPGVTIDGDGTFGASVLRYARESLGAAYAADSYGARFWRNDATPGVVLEHPKQLSDAAAKRIEETWNANHAGYRNARRTSVLEEGMKVSVIGMSHEDAQFLETRNFDVVTVCRWFRMQPHKIAHLLNATFSNIEHQSIEHVTDTIQPWAVRWERAIRRQLIQDKQRYFAEHLFDALLRGDTASRFAAYTSAVGGPWMTADEARVKENMNRIDGGDELLRPLNTTPAGRPAALAETEPLYANGRNGQHAGV